MIGVATVVLVNIGAAVAVLNGFGSFIMKGPVESEVVIIEEVPEIEEEPPPPPPIDVDLPPPPPQVILPNFIVESPPPQENQITQVVASPTPRPAAPVQAKPAPAPAVSVRSKPQSGKRFEKPDYPAAALRANEEGEVTVSVCVDANGRMSDVKLIKSSGSTRLDEATVRGMSKTRLEPAIGTDGKPMAYCNPPHQLTIVWDVEAEKKNR
jgi:protein TonB